MNEYEYLYQELNDSFKKTMLQEKEMPKKKLTFFRKSVEINSSIFNKNPPINQF